ncbi:homoserine kinase [Chitinivorax sp. PXF-14]|uniref:homoserine kinase n=1 Tax=Chitinivorax sp. PXF-14 TaxID=3230488 RepID=UPI003464F271
MSVFTPVTPAQMQARLKNYSIGTLVELKGILAGIENTNFFLTTSHGRYVLTLFEVLKMHELPFYINLMSHLSRHGVACPAPIADVNNEFLSEFNGKPSVIVTCLKGEAVMAPEAHHCAQIGEVLAEMHLAGQTYQGRMPNPRGPEWWTATAPQVYEFMAPEAAELLRREVQHQAEHRFDRLPSGAIHADLFRDNVLFDGDRVGGLIDFYFACNDVLLYDVAITVNDWCVSDDGDIDAAKASALLNAYNKVRPFKPEEVEAWGTMLRAGALRFWVSRLFDFHRPRPSELNKPKDPGHFQRVLEHHIARDPASLWL